MLSRTNRHLAFAALAAAGILWGFSVPLTKVGLDWLGGASLAVLRFAVAAPLLALAAPRGLRAAATPRVLASGAAGYGLVIVLQNLGIERTSVSHAALIVGAVPALVALITAGLGRGAAGPQAWAGFLLALAGVGLVAGSGGGGGATLGGDALVLGSAAMSAAFMVGQPGLLAGRDAVSVTAVQMAAGAVASAPFAFALDGLPAAPGGVTTVLAVLGLVIAGTLLPFSLFAIGQARVTPEVAGAFVNLEPLVGAVVGAAAFHDPFGAGPQLGAAAIVAGIALSTRPVRRRRPPGPPGASRAVPCTA